MPKSYLSSILSRLQVVGAFAAIYLIWGSTYLAIRIAIKTLPPFFLGGIRFTIAGTVLYCWAKFSGVARPNWINWRAAAGVSLLLVVVGNGGVAWAEQLVPSGITALLMSMIPLWTVLLDWLRPGGTKPGIHVVIGVLLGLSGIGLLIGPSTAASIGHVNIVEVIALIFSSLGWAIGSLYSQQSRLPASPILATGMEMLVGGVLLLLTGVFSGEWIGFNPSRISLSSALAVGYLIVFGSFVAFTSFTWLLKTVRPTLATSYAFVNPVVAVFLGWALADEPLTTRTLLSTIIIVIAVAIIISHKTRGNAEKTAEAQPEKRKGLQ